MWERWCFAMDRIVLEALVAGCLLVAVAAQADYIQQEQCVTASNRAGYCTTKAECPDQEQVDLRAATCSDARHYCCPDRNEQLPSRNRPKLLTQCDSNRGYCVKGDACSVRTFRLRSNRCPAYEEVCCPKNAFPEEFHATQVAKHDLSMGATTSTTSTTTTTTTTTTTSTTTTTTTPNPVGESDQILEILANTTPVSATTANSLGTSLDAQSSEGTGASEPTQLPLPLRPITPDQQTVESTDVTNATDSNENSATPTTNTSDAQLELTSSAESNDIVTSIIDTALVDDNSLQETDTTTIPVIPPNAADPPPTPALMAQFTPESFSYQDCGQLNLNGVVERTINEDFRAEYGEFPWMVALFQLPEQRYCCNGALIDPKAILTTAHCVTNCGGRAANIMVRFGEWNMSSTHEMAIPREDIAVKSVHQHPRYSPSALLNNIAVLELGQPVQYQATIQPVCLPSDNQLLRAMENMIATGWGRVMEENAPPTQILKRLDLQRMEPSICREALRRVRRPYPFVLDSSFVCSTTNHGDQERPCDGDAGAPVVVELPGTTNRYYLHGLVSWGYGCHQKQIPYTVLTKVVHFREWIDRIVSGFKKKAKKGHSKQRD
uniref:Peptidase S1 domain-containing protein n=1 Tax=Anopheles quadriannulatus TaxID=34691 RepID=A0A182X6T8_ANOQN